MDLKYFYTRFVFKVLNKLNKKLPVRKIRSKKHPKVYLMGTVEYMNYGDHAINLAENNILSDLGYDVISIPESVLDESLPLIQANLSPDDLFFCQGGGNMGDIWPLQERWRQAIYRAFPNNRIVVFSSSVNFDGMSPMLLDTQAAIKGCTNITFLMRDQFSYDFAVNNFPNNAKVHLVPDMVMTLAKAKSDQMRQNIVTTFLRRDVEKLADDRISNLVNDLRQQFEVIDRDTVSDYWYYITPQNREWFFDIQLREFQTSKLIVTDRLHGMIFAAITKTPAIVFDNNNHKIYHLYHTWLKNIKFIKFIDQSMSQDQINQAFTELMQNQDFEFPNEDFKAKIMAVLSEPVGTSHE
ncbi:polysaccharide pyruvyl transferase family protein [Periweissella ghanensis]|uniref:Polysaccharide pyruvyl transferase domain-containing protein n=1 Tax=Periweissella ghanensis TaxID=467997 RepID=A0ABM8ZEL6_9LACO|nr:polysaccharide pyruvyl transferase family protein [Periweissella ghanensis]MCM0600233.1 polysaccharide pyruvyl transferase family protein [Periweissella ghanensis]CAH0419135.1 hypothetical protein WGH24286_01582 [Periweissella ghanensis]